jgi:hypothetical protein
MASGDKSNGAGAGYVARDQLQVMAEEMSMGDIWRASKAAGDDRAELGMRSFWNAARRLELIAQDVDFETFIDQVRQEDFQAVNQERLEGKATGTAP